MIGLTTEKARCNSGCSGIGPPYSLLGRMVAKFEYGADFAVHTEDHSQVSLAISAARRPALTESRTIRRLRSGCRERSAKNKRSSM